MSLKRRLTKLAKSLRRNATYAERLLWQKLKNKQLEGFKFRRQQPIGNYIVDFVINLIAPDNTEIRLVLVIIEKHKIKYSKNQNSIVKNKILPITGVEEFITS